jgi:hypothetical protein
MCEDLRQMSEGTGGTERIEILKGSKLQSRRV